MRHNRLAGHPAQQLDRSKKVNIDFEGQSIEAYPGETVASALYASGVRIFTRSFKYHRPRGLLCVSGKCPNCLMTVDGVPNVRTCTEPVREGMQVRHQNAWPSLKRDLYSVIDRLDRFLPVGFYYKSLIHPRFMWHLAEPLIRNVAGLGKVDPGRVPDGHYEHLHLHTDVAVVGGGPAGISAALEAARQGARVTLIDDQPSLGGHLRTDTRRHGDVTGYAGLQGFEIAQRLAETLVATANIAVLSNATAFGFYEGNLLGVMQGRRLIKLRSKSVIVTTGCYEIPLVFTNNDLPGVMLGSGVQRLVQLYGVKPGERALVVTNNDQGYYVASDLLEAGVKILALADSRDSIPQHLEEAQRLKSAGVPLLAPYTIKEAQGHAQVKGAVISRLEANRLSVEEQRFTCDLICVCAGSQLATSLLQQAGYKLKYDSTLDEMVPGELAPRVYAAGDVTGIHNLRAALLQGKIAGLEATSSLLDAPNDKTSGDKERYLQELEEIERGYRESQQRGASLIVPHPRKKRFVCFCEDVTEKDICDAIKEGFEDIEPLKRYSTLSMGPCQGKMCLKASIAIAAEQTGRSLQDTGTTTSRPPIHPVPLGVLAGPAHIAIKQTPLHYKHLESEAKMMDLGPWKRPLTYGSPESEHRVVREGVGIIDVSTLGKLDVKGKDAGQLLDKVYTHFFSTLKIGRSRYGLICTDRGTIMDDGTVSRLGEEHYFITTTTGNVEPVEQWLKWWAAGTGLCVHINNVTSGFAAINMAGPKARDVLRKLTDIDLSSASFPYMGAVQGTVAGVTTLLLRIGFVGETGWEMHFPAEYGEYMWDTFMDAGKEFGIKPFGVEAQRILRLEKKHVIVGQDTDAVSNPLEAGMAWAVKFEKEDFIGKAGLLGIEQRGLRNKLVGFVMPDATVAKDGDPVVIGDKPVGRVTSSRFSPSLGRGFGLAWIPAHLAEDSGKIEIRVAGKPAHAQVFPQVFYDPEGKRLRE